jgi:hypothetical protein
VILQSHANLLTQDNLQSIAAIIAILRAADREADGAAGAASGDAPSASSSSASVSAPAAAAASPSAPRALSPALQSALARIAHVSRRGLRAVSLANPRFLDLVADSQPPEPKPHE